MIIEERRLQLGKRSSLCCGLLLCRMYICTPPVEQLLACCPAPLHPCTPAATECASIRRLLLLPTLSFSCMAPAAGEASLWRLFRSRPPAAPTHTTTSHWTGEADVGQEVEGYSRAISG